MKVTAITCDKCHDTIYSRARHDFRSCTCGSVSIDGGFDYVKLSGATFRDLFELEVNEVDKMLLYDDWNKRLDNFGLIKGVKRG